MNNKTFKTVWNCARRCYVAVNEKKNNAVKSSGKALLTAAVLGMPFVAAQAGEMTINPDKTVVVEGTQRVGHYDKQVDEEIILKGEGTLQVFNNERIKVIDANEADKVKLMVDGGEVIFSSTNGQILGISDDSGVQGGPASKISFVNYNGTVNELNMGKLADVRVDGNSILEIKGNSIFTSLENDGNLTANKSTIARVVNNGVIKATTLDANPDHDNVERDYDLINHGKIETGTLSSAYVKNTGLIVTEKTDIVIYESSAEGRYVSKGTDEDWRMPCLTWLTGKSGFSFAPSGELTDSLKLPTYSKPYLYFGDGVEIKGNFMVGDNALMREMYNASRNKEPLGKGVIVGPGGLLVVNLSKDFKYRDDGLKEELLPAVFFKFGTSYTTGKPEYDAFKLYPGAEVRIEGIDLKKDEDEKRIVLARGFEMIDPDKEKGFGWADGVEFTIPDEFGHAYEVGPVPEETNALVDSENSVVASEWAVVIKRLSMAESYPDVLLPGVFVKQPDGSVKDAHQLIKELQDQGKPVPGDLTYIQRLLKKQDLKPAERAVIMNKIAMAGVLGGVAQSTQGAAGMIVDGVYGHFDRIDVKSNNLWVDVLGSVNNGKSDAYSLPVGEMGLKSTKTGIVMGYDMPVAGDLVAGVSLSYLHDKLEGKGYGSADNKADTFGASLYADWKAADNIDLGAQVVYLHTTNKVKLDAGGKKVEAKPKTNAVVASLRASMDVPVDAFTITPHAGIDVVHARTGSYDTKLDGKALWSNKIESRTTVELPVGVSASTTFEKSGWTFSPKADLTVSTVLGSRDAKYTITGVSGYSNSFEARYTGRCSVKAGLGLRAENASGLSVAGFYDAVKSKNGLDNRVRFELRQSF